MADCCQNSSNSKKPKSRLRWWLLGGFAVVIGASWAFQGNPLVDYLAPLMLGVLVVIWFATLIKQRIGLGR